MAAKDALISEFTDAKWDAEATLDRIVITPTMTQPNPGPDRDGQHGLPQDVQFVLQSPEPPERVYLRRRLGFPQGGP